MTRHFTKLSQAVSDAAGSMWASLLAIAVILLWFVIGFIHGFTETHQLIINTGTTIVTFIMVFLIQAQSNRSDRAMQQKLDELIRVKKEANNKLMGIEHKEEK